MSAQEVSVFLLARQLLQPDVLVVDTRRPEDVGGVRIKVAVPYHPSIHESEMGVAHYERVIGVGPSAQDVVLLFSANHYSVYTKDLEVVAKEFPELCWCSISDSLLARLLEQPTTLVVDTRREGFNSGLRLKKAVNFIPNVGLTGWCRRVVSQPWYHTVVCYGTEAFSAVASFPGCEVHLYPGPLTAFAAAYPQHCFDPRRCSTYCHKEIANELAEVCDGLFIGSLVAAPTRHVILERRLSHIILITRSAEPEDCDANPRSPRVPNGVSKPPVQTSPHRSRAARPGSPPPSPLIGVSTSPLKSALPSVVQLLHLLDTGTSLAILDDYNAKAFLTASPPPANPSAADLPWVVALLTALLKQEHRVAVLCELGISRAPAVAAAFLHLAKGYTPAEALNMVNKLSNYCCPSDLLNTIPAFHSRNQYSSPYKDLVISHIMPGLLCGSLQSLTASRKGDAELDSFALQRCGVTHVLSLGERPSLPPTLQVLHVDVDDTERGSLAPHWPLCYSFIDEARLGGGTVLVHCLAGVSRTGAIIIGYLMHHFGAPLRDAFLLAWRKRPILQPNDAFLEELVRFEQQMFPTPSLPIAAVKDFELSHRLCFKWGV